MSLSFIQQIFKNASFTETWSLELLKIKTSRRNGIIYMSREIEMTPSGYLCEFVNELSNIYLGEKSGLEQRFNEVIDYDGTTDGKRIYKISANNNLIEDAFEKLLDAINNPDVEINPLEIDAKAYVLYGNVKVEGNEYSVKFISMQKPITTLKHKFWSLNGKFVEIKDKVVNLRNSVDVVIIDDIVYMLSLAGERLFNMEPAYKASCLEKLVEIETSNIMTDFVVFSDVASKGHNPRRFVSYNDKHLQMLENVNRRKKIAKQFKIPLEDNKFDTKVDGVSEKIVKLLCSKGMLDPFDDEPVEVSSARKWE